MSGWPPPNQSPTQIAKRFGENAKRAKNAKVCAEIYQLKFKPISLTDCKKIQQMCKNAKTKCVGKVG